MPPNTSRETIESSWNSNTTPVMPETIVTSAKPTQIASTTSDGRRRRATALTGAPRSVVARSEVVVAITRNLTRPLGGSRARAMRRDQP